MIGTEGGLLLGFAGVLLVLVFLTLVYQLITKMKIVGANELAVVAGKGPTGFATLRGGRVFVWPLIHRFFRIDLRPQTTSVRVESAIAGGIVPLTVEATVSFAVASAGKGLRNAIRRIMFMTSHWHELTVIATSIIEGHLRDSIATMTPEQVMTDKDVLVQNMIRVCKADLEGIGLEITSMNIADVDDHRLEGVQEPELYIALLKRIQTANAETQSRQAQAMARAAAKEAAEARRAEVAVRTYENERENILAQTRVKIATERQRSAVGVQKATRDAEAQAAGITAQIEAEQQRIEMLRAKYTAEILTPAEAERERRSLEAQTQAATLRGRAQAEIDQLKRTIEILHQGGPAALQAYLIENFEKFIQPFAQTLDLFPVKQTTVITGAGNSHLPLSGIHPHPIEEEKARLLQQAFGVLATTREAQAASKS
jgi:regulator of protease activity HflC (stomatin/prohibitin superfamily)